MPFIISFEGVTKSAASDVLVLVLCVGTSGRARVPGHRRGRAIPAGLAPGHPAARAPPPDPAGAAALVVRQGIAPDRPHIRTPSLRLTVRCVCSLFLRFRRRSPSPQPKKLHVGNLTRNVNEEHLREIFGLFGKLQRVELGWDRRTDLPKGFAYVEYEKHEHSLEAIKRMDGVRDDAFLFRSLFQMDTR